MERFVILKTVAETDYELSRWAEKLSSNRFLELGSDPLLLKEIEETLSYLARRIRTLDTEFNIAKVSVSQAKFYFTVTNELNNAVLLLRDIRRQAYGSKQNTQRCLEQIELCMVRVREMGQMIAPGLSARMH